MISLRERETKGQTVFYANIYKPTEHICHIYSYSETEFLNLNHSEDTLARSPHSQRRLSSTESSL